MRRPLASEEEIEDAIRSETGHVRDLLEHVADHELHNRMDVGCFMDTFERIYGTMTKKETDRYFEVARALGLEDLHAS